MKTHANNISLFKSIGFYQMVDLNTPKLFGFNVYHLINTILTVLSATVTVIGLSGMFYNINAPKEYSVKQYFELISSAVFIAIGYLKMFILINNSDKILCLFDVAKETFFSSKHCKKFYYKLENCGKWFTTTFYLYLFLYFCMACSWIMMPLFLNARDSVDEIQNNENIHKINVINYMYPITLETYNTYYTLFYVLESIICAYAIFVLSTFDMFVIILLKIISTQNEIISSAYENIEFKDNDQDSK